MATSNDEVAQEVGSEQEVVNAKHLARLGLSVITDNQIKKTFVRRRQEAFRKLTNGTALEVMILYKTRLAVA